MSSTYGKNIQISIFGQSHSEAIGVTIDGLPAGIKIDLEALSAFLKRRAPGSSDLTTPRKEADEPKFLSGLLNNITCGAPLTAIIENTNTRSKDYSAMQEMPRPAHADFTAHQKYKGFEDVRGGGHFSGRLTAPLCIAGGICKQILEKEQIFISAAITEIGGQTENMLDAVRAAKEENDSVGGIISCRIDGLPVGLGEPMFDGVENKIAAAVFAVPAVKGIEFGEGFAAAKLRGSENNDAFYYDENSEVKTETNHHGGILGGITSGMPVTFRVAMKPTPSIGKAQTTIRYDKTETATLKIEGRHDPCVVLRAVPCIEAAAAIAVYDLYLDAKKQA